MSAGTQPAATRLERLYVGFWLVVSGLLHLGLMYWVPVVGAQPRPPAWGEGPRQNLHVRLVGVDPKLVQARTLRVQAEPPAPPAMPGSDTPVPAPSPAQLEPPAAPLAQAAPAGALVVPLPAPDSAYLPRSRLTVPPEPTTEIVIPDPGGLAGTDAQLREKTVILTLYINEEGWVDRITVDTPDPDPGVELAAKKAFGSARFTPGEIDGKRVKSRMRIEVGLEPVSP